MCQAISSAVGNPATPPNDRMERAPQMFPSLRHRAGGSPRSQAWRKPALKQSPAPVVSTAVTAGGSAHNNRPSASIAAPRGPSFRTTVRAPARASERSIASGSRSPVRRSASTALGKTGRPSAAPQDIAHRYAGNLHRVRWSSRAREIGPAGRRRPAPPSADVSRPMYIRPCIRRSLPLRCDWRPHR